MWEVIFPYIFVAQQVGCLLLVEGEGGGNAAPVRLGPRIARSRATRGIEFHFPRKYHARAQEFSNSFTQSSFVP